MELINKRILAAVFSVIVGRWCDWMKADVEFNGFGVFCVNFAECVASRVLEAHVRVWKNAGVIMVGLVVFGILEKLLSVDYF